MSSPTKAKVRKPHRKLRLGCLTCKARKIKCLETMPKCHQCVKSGRRCGFEDMDEETKANHRAAQRLNEAIANSRVDVSPKESGQSVDTKDSVNGGGGGTKKPSILVDTSSLRVNPLFTQMSPNLTPQQLETSHLSPWIDTQDFYSSDRLPTSQNGSQHGSYTGSHTDSQLVLPVSPMITNDDDEIIKYFESEWLRLAPPNPSQNGYAGYNGYNSYN